MSKAHYVRAVARTLREVVIPAVEEPIARDSLSSCLLILAALAIALEAPDHPGPDHWGPKHRGADHPRPAEIPVDLLALLAKGRAAELPAGLLDDVAVSSKSIDLIVAGQTWMNTVPLDNLENLATLERLLKWERELRDARLDVIADATTLGSVSSSQEVGDIEPAALQAYLSSRFGGDVRILDFKRVMGGRSRQTALFSQHGVADMPRDLVVQRDPPTGLFVAGVAVQAQLLFAMDAIGMCVPKPYLVELERPPLGAAFMIVQRMPGRPIIDATTEYFKVPPAGLETVAHGMARQMALMHSASVESMKGILDTSFALDGNEDWPFAIASLRTRLEELSNGPSMVVTAGLLWLERQAPGIATRWSIVHGDMLLHNLLAENGEVTGVLDWEISHIGHPGEDLGYVRPVVEQILPWREFLDVYEAAGGAALNRVEIDFFSIYAGIRLLVLAQSARTAFESGVIEDLRMGETGAAFIPQLVGRIAGLVLSAFASDRVEIGRETIKGQALTV